MDYNYIFGQKIFSTKKCEYLNLKRFFFHMGLSFKFVQDLLRKEMLSRYSI